MDIKSRTRIILPLMMFGRNRGKDYIPGQSNGLFPSVNHIYINTKTGRKLSPIAESKLEEWKWIARQWAIQNHWKTTENEKVILRLWWYLNDNRKKDTHNAKKLLLDSLEGVIYDNDYYALDRTIDFGIDRENPRIEIEVEVAG